MLQLLIGNPYNLSIKWSVDMKITEFRETYLRTLLSGAVNNAQKTNELRDQVYSLQQEIGKLKEYDIDVIDGKVQGWFDKINALIVEMKAEANAVEEIDGAAEVTALNSISGPSS